MVIPYARQEVTEADIAAVCAVLRSDFLTQGPAVPEFEHAVAAYCGAAHAVAMNSATSALHLACRALDLGAGDWLWTSPNSFVASANCAHYCGAQVDFIDIDPATGNLCPTALAQRLASASASNRLPKIVVPVHFAGEPCDLAAIHALAQRYGFRILEDASHALGARYQDSQIGDCRYSDIVVFSLHPVKLITTGEGGLALTQDAALAERMRGLRSHGITRDLSAEPSAGAWEYRQVELGYNARLTDLQAALGSSQLQRLDAYRDRRHALAARYDHAFADWPLQRFTRAATNHSALHLYPIQVNSRQAVFDQLRAAGIGVNVHYMPIYLQPYYRALGFAPGHCPHAEAYYQHAISLPLFPTLSEAQQDQVIAALDQALNTIPAPPVQSTV